MPAAASSSSEDSPQSSPNPTPSLPIPAGTGREQTALPAPESSLSLGWGQPICLRIFPHLQCELHVTKTAAGHKELLLLSPAPAQTQLGKTGMTNIFQCFPFSTFFFHLIHTSQRQSKGCIQFLDALASKGAEQRAVQRKGTPREKMGH